MALLLSMVLVSGMAGITAKQIRIWENSFTLWERERQIFPFEPLALMQLGLANYSTGEYKRAAFYYTSAIQINPYNATYYKLRAGAYMKMGKFRLANSDLERSLQLSPGDMEVMRYLSVVREALLM
ncbi:MAG TPA: tetratricopeptide repeat protein [Nitrospirae bacterium]|nr:tetratricopeptide repeat protein [Nitrospirota bacterium]